VTITFDGTADRIRILNMLAWSEDMIERIVFADGTLDLNGVKARLNENRGTDGDDTINGFTSITNRIDGGPGNDTLIGGPYGDTLRGGADNDHLEGGNGNDELAGGADNDRLEGGNGYDRLEGGRGDDTLHGGQGSDIYVFSRGDGRDVIEDNGGGSWQSYTDQLVIHGYNQAEAHFTPEQGTNNVTITFDGTADRIRILNMLAWSEDMIERIVFADGTLDSTDVIQAVSDIM
jgi:Ca2+-binding RTX toxin-like protein